MMKLHKEFIDMKTKKLAKRFLRQSKKVFNDLQFDKKEGKLQKLKYLLVINR